MAVKCGNHQGTKVYHESAAEVRACYTGRTGAEPPATSVFEQASQARHAETHAWIHEGETLARETTDNEKRILDRMAKDLDPTGERREAYRRAWADDTATETVPVPAPARRGDATEKQISYVRSLLAGRVAPTEDFRAYADAVASAVEAGTLMKRDASRAIERMNGWAKRPRSYTEDASGQFTTDPVGTLATEDGIYRNPVTGEIFKGQFNRGQGDGRHLYFKRLRVVYYDTEAGAFAGDGHGVTNIPLDAKIDVGSVVMSWDYAGGAAKAKVQKAWRMTREEAAKFGALYGVCVRCHRTLTKEESIDRAMGDKCASKMGW